MNILKPLAIIAAVSLSPAYAGPCDDLGTIAESVMTVRQAGMPIATVLTHMEEFMLDDGSGDLIRSIILQAYGSFGFSGEAAQQRAIVEFTNEITVACYRAQI